MTIPVLEIFGPTIQGEGMVIGQKTMFVRTAGCDYACSWCDSKFTWDGSTKGELMSAEEIISKLIEIGGHTFSHVTISGGNPALHKGLDTLIERCHEQNWQVAVETQGSIWQEWMKNIDDVTISPKPPSSNMKTNMKQLDHYVRNLSETKSNFSLKIVIFNDEDFMYAKKMYKRYPHVPFYLQVGNEHIENVKDDELLAKLLTKYEWLIEKTMEDHTLKDVKVLPQLHTFVWGNKRGV